MYLHASLLIVLLTHIDSTGSKLKNIKKRSLLSFSPLSELKGRANRTDTNQWGKIDNVPSGAFSSPLLSKEGDEDLSTEPFESDCGPIPMTVAAVCIAHQEPTPSGFPFHVFNSYINTEFTLPLKQLLSLTPVS
jgi:hypothetical protein